MNKRRQKILSLLLCVTMAVQTIAPVYAETVDGTPAAETVAAPAEEGTPEPEIPAADNSGPQTEENAEPVQPGGPEVSGDTGENAPQQETVTQDTQTDANSGDGESAPDTEAPESDPESPEASGSQTESAGPAKPADPQAESQKPAASQSEHAGAPEADALQKENAGTPELTESEAFVQPEDEPDTLDEEQISGELDSAQASVMMLTSEVSLDGADSATGHAPVITVTPQNPAHALVSGSVGYYCEPPQIQITDEDGDLSSAKVEAKHWSNPEKNKETSQSLSGGEGTVDLTEYSGSITITVSDEGGNTAISQFSIAHVLGGRMPSEIPATCTEPAKVKNTCICKLCEANYDSSITDKAGSEPLGHDFAGVSGREVQLCGQQEKVTLKICNRCQQEFAVDDQDQVKELPLDGAGHQWSDEKERPAACEAAGAVYQECTACGAMKVLRSIPATGHDFGLWHIEEPGNCETPQKQVRRCKNCEKKIVQENKVSHSWSPRRETLKEATCTEEGYTGFRCTVCGAEDPNNRITLPMIPHNYSANGDCTQKAVCTMCNEEVEGQTAHNFDASYQYDDHQHWKQCTNPGCTVKSEVGTHQRSGSETDCTNAMVCTVCRHQVGAQYTSHEWDEYQTDGTYHWLVCSHEGCTATGKKEAHKRKDDRNCETADTCTVCGYVFQEAMTHQFADKYQETISRHWKQCTNPGCSFRGSDQEHVYEAYTDCTKGLKCTICGYTSIYERLEHRFQNAPYHSDETGHYQICMNAGCKVEGIHEPHQPGEKATCRDGAICSVCQHAYGPVDKTNHVGGTEIVNQKNATETEKGYTGDEKCLGCGEILRKGEDIPVLPPAHEHQYTEHKYDDKKSWDACSICGDITNERAHKLSISKRDQTSHWSCCETCQYETSKVPHTLDEREVDNDCSTPIHCKYCPYVMVKAEQHRFADEWISGKDGHWQICANDNCAVTSEKAAHRTNDDGDCTTEVACLDCGYCVSDASGGHVWSNIMETDAEGHFYRCVNVGCSQVNRTPHTPAPDDGNCTTPVVCSVCEWEISAGAAAHTFSGDYEHDETGHWQRCRNDGCTAVNALIPHAGGEATCEQQAVCIVCGQSYGEKDADNHSGGIVYQNYTAPTEEMEGYSGDVVCLGCGKTQKSGRPLDKLEPGHEHFYEQEMCDDRYHWLECSCGGRDAGSCQMHTFDAAWESEAAHHWHACTECGKIVSQAHQYENGDVCTVCNAQRPRHTHSYEWRHDGENHWQECSECGEHIQNAAHEWKQEQDETAHWQKCPVCQATSGTASHSFVWKQDGEGHWQECTACGRTTGKTSHSYAQKQDSAGHWQECTVCGMAAGKASHSYVQKQDGAGHWQVCSACGMATAREAHAFGGWTEIAGADVFQAALQEGTCGVCGYKQRRSYGAKREATVELTAHSLKMSVKQKTSRFGASGFAPGDYLANVTSDRSELVKVSHINRNGSFTLEAQSRTGTAILTILLASGLTRTVPVTVQKPKVKTTSVTGVPRTLTLMVSHKHTLTPALVPVTSQDKITYRSSNAKVASVTQKGVISAKKAGTAKITVKAGKKSFVCTVKVQKAESKKITGVPASASIKTGRSLTLKPKLHPAGGGEKITYKSSNKKVATVNAHGVVTAKKKGTATITVKSGSVQVKCKVKVK